MLRTCVSTNVCPSIRQKMKYGQYKVDQIVDDFEQNVREDGFTQLVYSCLKLYYGLVNPKLADCQGVLHTFQQQHYHEFLFHYKQRGKKCTAFIQAMKEFDQLKKPKKKDYVDLFSTLSGFKDVLGTLPGGHVNGKPFVFSDQRQQHWFYDEVAELKKSLRITDRNKELFYPVEKDNKWTGHTQCAANCTRPNKMTKQFADYLIRVGYETREAVERKWALDLGDLTTGVVHNWALFEKNTEDINSVLTSVSDILAAAVETAVKTKHLGQSRENIRDKCHEQLVCRLKPDMDKLRQEWASSKRNYEQLKDTASEHEMMLSLQRRKTNGAYEENEYLKTRLDSMKSTLIQSEQAHDRLKNHYNKVQQDLQASIRREWQYYNQMQNKRPRFR